jgi:hypothetical protein
MTENVNKVANKPLERIKRPLWVLVTAMLIMIIFDQVTWEKQFGVQFLLITLLLLIGLFLLTTSEKKKIPWRSFLLLVPILLGSIMTIFRREMSTTFFNIVLTLISLLVLALTFLSGSWLDYRFRDLLTGILRLAQSVFISPVSALVKKHKTSEETGSGGKKERWNKVQPFLRGLLIAIPILIVLGALLASADLIFQNRLSNLFDWLKIENLGEIIWRTIYIVILAYLLAGAFIHALTISAEKKTLGEEKPWIKPFLGTTEAFIVLGLVNLLFLSFIIIQFRYFFAGTANISVEGFTYAEYARRGFFELVAVALISLGLFYLLSQFTKRAEPKFKRVFSFLGILLMLQVGCMLVSAFQRLSLYEAAYGFTTLRTITHVFMIWLSVLLLAVTLMEIFNQFKRMALVLFLVFFGFTLTLNVVNVDRFIARQNIQHAIAGNPLDAEYLIRNLSNDGIPEIYKFIQADGTPQDIKQALNAALACDYLGEKQKEGSDFWSEWHFSDVKARNLFEVAKDDLESFPFIIREEEYVDLVEGTEENVLVNDYFIRVDGKEIWCTSEMVDP